MKRFYFGSEDGDEGEEGEADAFDMAGQEFIAMAAPESPFRHLMDFSIRICEKNFVWRFLSPSDKVAMIREVFERLSQIEKEYERHAEIRDEM